MNLDRWIVFPRLYAGLPISRQQALNLIDSLALAWIFLTVLAIGLLTLSFNLYSILFAVFSGMLGGIWWLLSHYKH